MVKELIASPPLPICEYVSAVSKTDRFSDDELQPILLGLFGEVGSVMAAVKKHLREKSAFWGYQEVVEEEFGDAFWYFTALVRRLGFDVSDLMSKAVEQCDRDDYIAASGQEYGVISTIGCIKDESSIDEVLLKLGEVTSSLLTIRNKKGCSEGDLISFLKVYLIAIQHSRQRFSDVLNRNMEKVNDRFLLPDLDNMPVFDAEFPDEERLPDRFEIRIQERKSGKSQLSWNGVFIGDPLTDSIMDPDAYRFHDVFHIAHAAILHWSPTFRALIKHKRKSDPKFDINEDGGRAIVVEEGLTAWVFARAKNLEFFEGQDKLSYDLLKSIREFVQGYEVERCPLSLWERAILEGYKVFREVKKNGGGIVVGDRSKRTVEYRSLSEKK